jgi:two-component system OmpR family sensor kinase
MNIRHKITLLISGVGFLTSLVFSCVVFWEMLEQPFRIIDSDLEATANRAARAILTGQQQPGSPPDDLALVGTDRYWFKVYDQSSHTTLYKSYLATIADISPTRASSNSMVSTVIPRELINLGQDRRNEVTFRIRTLTLTVDGRRVLVQIGRPVEKLEREVRDLVTDLAGGLAVSTVLLLVVAYFVAGLILKPIGAINQLARNINEKSLDRRIPVRPSRDEFDELAGTLNGMFDRLQHSFGRQKRLLADAAHELKTPLTMLRLSLDHILSGYPDALPLSTRQSLLRQNDQVLRMERLVKNMLGLSSLELSETVKFETVDLAGLLEALLAEYRLLADARNLRIETRIPGKLTIQGDAEKLTRALVNVMDNAVKYNCDGGRIELAATTTDTALTLSVGNTGAGIPESDLDKVFEEFYRVEKSRSIRYGGSGLGLAIVKRIVQLHGGSVRMESEPGVWTKLTIDLPRAVT